MSIFDFKGAKKDSRKVASKIIAQAKGPNRAMRRGLKFRDLPKQTHLLKRHVADIMLGKKK